MKEVVLGICGNRDKTRLTVDRGAPQAASTWEGGDVSAHSWREAQL